MTTSLDHLLTRQPNWVSIQKQKLDKVRIIAQPPIGNSGLKLRPYSLELSLQDANIIVREYVECDVKRLLPTACPCRHINGQETNFSFCLGKDWGTKVIDSRTADFWWDHLNKFLAFQEVAEKTKIWPPFTDENGVVYNDLSHGSAADFQIKAETLASKLGMRQFYDDTLLRRHDIFKKLPILPKNKQKGKTIFINGRFPCSLGCVKKGKPILRRNCPKIDIWKQFVEAEAKRQYRQQKFIENYEENGCNLDMKYCEFRKK